jgi:uncharacterized protein DUF3618
MESQSARLEREAEETLWQLSGTLEELRARMTPGRVVDQVIDYTRDSPAAEFFRDLRREVRQNPMPLVLVGIGVIWLLLEQPYFARRNRFRVRPGDSESRGPHTQPGRDPTRAREPITE